jgi:catechol 2,3-dioxygenase-like lactoylglutathione lyase family enzyme
MMLEHAFAGFSVSDLSRAKNFYHDTLGLEVEDHDGWIALHFEGGSDVMIYGKQNHQPASYTVLNFPVKKIDDAVDELARKGVAFEHYEGDIATDEKGIHRGDERFPSIAWFKDPDGNILSVLES